MFKDLDIQSGVRIALAVASMALPACGATEIQSDIDIARSASQTRVVGRTPTPTPTLIPCIQMEGLEVCRFGEYTGIIKVQIHSNVFLFSPDVVNRFERVVDRIAQKCGMGIIETVTDPHPTKARIALVHTQNLRCYNELTS